MHVVLLRRVDGKFGRRQPEDQPAVADIDMRELEHLAQQGAVGLGALTVDDRMRADDHGYDQPLTDRALAPDALAAGARR